MDVDGIHSEFLRWHVERRRGERKRRLEEGHGHAEALFFKAVWVPGVGSWEHLHPEFEIADYRGRARFVDYAFIRPPVRLVVEIDGYSSHEGGDRTSRRRFTDDRFRQNSLVIDGWFVLRFSYDALVYEPHECQRTLQLFMGRWVNSGNTDQLEALPPRERAVLRRIHSAGRPITIAEAAACMHVSRTTARRILRAMAAAGHLQAARGTQRITAYQLGPRAKQLGDNFLLRL